MADNKLAPPSKNKLPWYEQALSMKGRAAFLPYQDTLPGSVMNQRSFALPGIIAGAANAITAPGRAYSGSDPMFDPQEEAANFAMNVMGGGVGASRSAPAGSLGMNTWHGSPHRFPPTAKNPLGEFDPMKIGTGEGAQAYGRGLYLAENPGVAVEYQRKLAAGMKPNVVDANLQKLYDQTGDWGTAVDQHLRSVYNTPKVKAQMREAMLRNGPPLNTEGGSLYKVDLPDEQIAKMLDWDKPLSQQMHLMNQTGPHGPDFTFKNLLERFGIDPATTTGGQFLHEVGMGRGREKAAALSKTLSEYGIPGIRYFDQGSRAGGKGTSNFVVFDPKHMNIIGRE